MLIFFVALLFVQLLILDLFGNSINFTYFTNNVIF